MEEVLKRIEKFYSPIVQRWALEVYHYLPTLIEKQSKLVKVGDYDEVDTSAFDKEIDYFCKIKLLPIYMNAVKKKRGVDLDFVTMSAEQANKRVNSVMLQTEQALDAASLELASREFDTVTQSIDYAMAWRVGIKKLSLPSGTKKIESENDVKKISINFSSYVHSTIQEAMRSCCYKLLMFLQTKSK